MGNGGRGSGLSRRAPPAGSGPYPSLWRRRAPPALRATAGAGTAEEAGGGLRGLQGCRGPHSGPDSCPSPLGWGSRATSPVHSPSFPTTALTPPPTRRWRRLWPVKKSGDGRGGEAMSEVSIHLRQRGFQTLYLVQAVVQV